MAQAFSHSKVDGLPTLQAHVNANSIRVKWRTRLINQQSSIIVHTVLQTSAHLLVMG